MTQKNQSSTEQDYLAKQRAQEISQLGRPTNGYANVQEMEEALRKSRKEAEELNRLIVEEEMRKAEQERREREEIESTPYLAELEEVKKQLARKEDDLAGVRELNRKHVDKIRVLQNDLDEATAKNGSLSEGMKNTNEEKQFLEEVLGHILIKTDKRYHRSSLKGKDKVAKAYALPYNVVREYVSDDTIRFYQDQYQRRESRFRDGMKGMF